MEYLHAALLLHSAHKPIDEDNIGKVLNAAGVTPDEARIKALVAALEGVDIEEAINTSAGFAAAPTAAPAAAPTSEKPAAEAKAEEAKEEEEEEDLGLTSLFG
jgi:large subunit ribosomal protein L12